MNKGYYHDKTSLNIVLADACTCLLNPVKHPDNLWLEGGGLGQVKLIFWFECPPA